LPPSNRGSYQNGHSPPITMCVKLSMRQLQELDLVDYVKDLPVDDLKIDKSFIDGLGKDAVNDAIVRLIVDFAHTLGLEVTAEGVENDRQVVSLTAITCDLTQGFYFSKPLPSEAAGRSRRRTLVGVHR
jgi:EAL domain-containing protein (putative c-di-GMP-specific phosphodiesterase class I)